MADLTSMVPYVDFRLHPEASRLYSQLGHNCPLRLGLYGLTLQPCHVSGRPPVLCPRQISATITQMVAIFQLGLSLLSWSLYQTYPVRSTARQTMRSCWLS